MADKMPVQCIVSVNALITFDSNILLVQLNKAKFKGLWGLPGGKVDEGENFEEALKREILEETGLESINYNFKKIGILHDRPDVTCKHIFEVILKNPFNDFKFDPAEISSVQWFNINKDLLEKIEYRNTWVFPVIRDYIDGKFESEYKFYTLDY